MENSPVLFEEISCANSKKIGVATLNMPNKLNALSLPMIKLLLPQLKSWQVDNDVVAVFLQGAGDKAFCAGGDVVSVYNELAKKSSDNISHVVEFFSEEYTLDHLIHCYKKPFIVWGSGIVMGGGLGLMAGASHRIATETTKMAMPEINIGLYPDVGATWFLSRMPSNIGLFLGLTAAQLNAGDANYLGLSDYYINSRHKDDFLTALSKTVWHENIADNHSILSACIEAFVQQTNIPMPESMVRTHQELIAQTFDHQDLPVIVEKLNELSLTDDWFKAAQATLAKGSPLSACLIYEQLHRGKTLSLAQCFKLELNLSIKSAQFGEFKEGVRALLVDKDKAPQWHYPDIDAVEEETIEWFFQPFFSDEQHPLNELENS